MTSMVEKVAEAIASSLTKEMAGYGYADVERLDCATVDGVIDIHVIAKDAIAAVFAGSRFTEFSGMTLVANPAFKMCYWDGKRILDVMPASPSVPSKG